MIAFPQPLVMQKTSVLLHFQISSPPREAALALFFFSPKEERAHLLGACALISGIAPEGAKRGSEATPVRF